MGELSTACHKPAKGSGLIARRERQKAIRAHEAEQKKLVRQRDVTCRWPGCENCRRYKPRLECAHLDGKGSGGDHSVRSDASNMILLDYITHQGPHSLHAETRRVEPLTSRGTHGPCRFWELREEGWVVVHTEDARG